MDERKRYGVLTALGKALGEQAKENPSVLADLRAVNDLSGMEAVLVKYRGRVPEALVREFAHSAADADVPRDRARLLLQAKMTMKGQDPVTGQDAERGPVTGR